jgi:hypothetical protein
MVETQPNVEWLQRLVRIRAPGRERPGRAPARFDEGRIAAQVATWFEALGDEVEREDVYLGRPNSHGASGTRPRRPLASSHRNVMTPAQVLDKAPDPLDHLHTNV